MEMSLILRRFCLCKSLEGWKQAVMAFDSLRLDRCAGLLNVQYANRLEGGTHG